MSVTINAKGTSTTSFKVGKAGTIITQGGVISPPAATDLKIDLDVGQNLVIDAGLSGPSLITTSDNRDLHINPATGGGQYLVLVANRWPVVDGTANQVLATNGSGILSWTTISGTGTVTSVGISGANGIGVASSPITSSGTIALSLGNITPTSVAASGTVTGSNLSGSSSGTNTGDQTITLTSDVTGSGTGSFATTLATVNASPQTDTFRKITVNGKGLTTATSAVASGDITTALGYTPVNNAGGTMTGLLILSADPAAAFGAATKQYVDAQVVSASTGLAVVVVAGTTQTAVSGSMYVMTAASSASTLTLPASPAAGATVAVSNFTGRTDLVIARNSSAIMQINEDMTVDALKVTVTLKYINSTIGWIVI